MVVLHEGPVTGPAVAGTGDVVGRSHDLTFTPAAPLKFRTTYVVHYRRI